MLLGGKSYKTVFLLGAGASRGALQHVLLNNKRIKPPLNSDFFKVAETYGRAQGKESADTKRLQHLMKLFEQTIPFHGSPTMEEAFSMLYVAKDFPEIYRSSYGRKRTVYMHRDIEDFLRLTFGILFVIDSTPKATAYDRLVSRLESHDLIISLNYDTLLDSALARYGWSPKTGYNLLGGSKKIEWNPVASCNEHNAFNVKLLKLHGSMNWYVRGNYSRLSKVFSAKTALVAPPRKNEMNGYIRQIIPPMYGKIFEHNHWRHLWTTAYEALCRAEVLVVIGCSLIDTDFHLRALLSKTIMHRKNVGSKLQKAVFVAGVKTSRKWQRVLRGGFRMVDGYRDFEHFLVKGLRV